MSMRLLRTSLTKHPPMRMQLLPCQSAQPSQKILSSIAAAAGAFPGPEQVQLLTSSSGRKIPWHCEGRSATVRCRLAQLRPSDHVQQRTCKDIVSGIVELHGNQVPHTYIHANDPRSIHLLIDGRGQDLFELTTANLKRVYESSTVL
mmetsp:Transcript_65481/g.114574  ORF Transcript_65481/g.114574 Transcript_65481/m.114574 type:complete len:147 (+) Transcript_65481:84-524(+)